MVWIDVTPAELQIVKKILGHHVPEYEVRVFGSRISGKVAETSDLDLVVMTAKPLDTMVKIDLKEAFSESDIPFKVDIVDWASTGDRFRKIIEEKFIIIQKASKNSGN